MSDQNPSFDVLMPKDMAVKAENIGIIKAGLDKYRMMALGGIPLTGQEEE